MSRLSALVQEFFWTEREQMHSPERIALAKGELGHRFIHGLGNNELGWSFLTVDYDEKMIRWNSFFPYGKVYKKVPKTTAEKLEHHKAVANLREYGQYHLGAPAHAMTLVLLASECGAKPRYRFEYGIPSESMLSFLAAQGINPKKTYEFKEILDNSVAFANSRGFQIRKP